MLLISRASQAFLSTSNHFASSSTSGYFNTPLNDVNDGRLTCKVLCDPDSSPTAFTLRKLEKINQRKI